MQPPPGLDTKRPPAWANWSDCGAFPTPGDPFRHVWRRGRLTVLSSLLLCDFRGEQRWQWLVSVSVRGNYACDAEVERALRDFGMQGADEDNHEPGAVRKFWLPCDLKPGEESACECKATEETITEANGLAWQQERGGDVEGRREVWAGARRAAKLFGTR